MVIWVFMLLVSFGFGESAIFFVRENENEDEPVNLKLTKLLDVKVQGKSGTVQNDIGKLLHSQIDENYIRKNDESVDIPMKFTFAVDKKDAQNEENDLSSMFNFAEGCRSLVGTSKDPLCHFNKKVQKLDSEKLYPRSCREILEKGSNKTGIYEIQPRASVKPFSVLCDMETNGGGWTVFQRRFDGSQDFYLFWRNYKFGFGDLNGEFWLGLEHLYYLTAFERSELYVELTDRDKKTAYAHYASFSIGSEQVGYPLNLLTGYTGDAGDALKGHLNAKFTTQDVDQDANTSGNCAQIYQGAWWYTTGHASNLNGKFMNMVLPDAYKFHGLNWSGWRAHEYNLAGSRMMVRPTAG